jgi:hypothetical protein
MIGRFLEIVDTGPLGRGGDLALAARAAREAPL